METKGIVKLAAAYAVRTAIILALTLLPAAGDLGIYGDPKALACTSGASLAAVLMISLASLSGEGRMLSDGAAMITDFAVHLVLLTAGLIWTAADGGFPSGWIILPGILMSAVTGIVNAALLVVMLKATGGIIRS